ncbi:winged helix-turn-helix transcriptional regulator, partial [Escherichia coli]|nr:winged helix-turn-helix transcriptional regulator [Escherichia coli]
TGRRGGGGLFVGGGRGGSLWFRDRRGKNGGGGEKGCGRSLQGVKQEGFFTRNAYPVVAPDVEYSLTPLGEQVSEKVAALADWIELNLPEVLAVRDERAA